MYKKLLLLNIVCLCSAVVWSQEVLSTATVLSQQSVPLLDQWEEGINFLQSGNQNIPLVNKMEIRTETDEWLLQQQEYVFRTSFNSRVERKVHQQLISEEINYRQLKGQSLALAHRQEQYKYIVELYYNGKILEQLAAYDSLLVDAKVVNERQLANASLGMIEDLLKVEDDIQAGVRKKMEIEWNNQQSWQALGYANTSNLALETANWVTLPTMQQVIERCKDDYSILLAMQNTKVVESELKYKADKAAARQVLDFVQAKYKGHPKLDHQEEWSIGVGINIPTKANQRAKLNDDQLEIIDETYKYNNLQAAIAAQQQQAVANFEYALKAYGLLYDQIEAKNSLATIATLSQNPNVDPLVLIKLKMKVIEDQKMLVRAEQTLCLAYLEVLQQYAGINQLGTNYLTNTLDDVIE